MDVCKGIMSLQHDGTLNSRKAANPLKRLGEKEESWDASEEPQDLKKTIKRLNKTRGEVVHVQKMQYFLRQDAVQ
ncbi:hypothetical protein TNCV_4233731 [Trichonephila clavipes]|nr:hypothetical protein TNCV_4233731 [Trichonephila clavipes]